MIINIILKRLEEAAALEAFEAERTDDNTGVAEGSNTKQISSYDNQKQQRREQRKLERQIEQCEEKIEQYENDITHIDEQLTQPEIFNDPIKASELANEKAETEQKLEQVMMEWEELQEML